MLVLVATSLCACGPDSSRDPAEPEWAFDVFHLTASAGGSDFLVYKIEVRDDETTVQTTLRCSAAGTEEDVSTAQWKVEGDEVAVLPEAPDGTVTFAEGQHARLVLRQGGTCDELEFDSYSVSDVFQGTGTLTRGDMCLNCAEFAEAQLQWCDGQPPEPCQSGDQ